MRILARTLSNSCSGTLGGQKSNVFANLLGNNELFTKTDHISKDVQQKLFWHRWRSNKWMFRWGAVNFSDVQGPSETDGSVSSPQLFSHFCSENVIIVANVYWSPAKQWFVFHLPRGVSNFCHVSTAKMPSCLQLFDGLQGNDESSLSTHGGGQLLS